MVRIIVGLVMIAAGVMHFVYPKAYGAVTPNWVPLKQELILGSGAAEILVGLALCFPATQYWGAVGLMILMISFLPLHVLHIFQPPASLTIPYWVFLVRLPLQLVFIYGAFRLTEI